MKKTRTIKKILWLCSYPVSLIQPELKLGRKKVGHSASWVVNLSKELVKKNEDIELHIITKSQLVPFSQNINKNGINFHVIRSALPFTYKGYPKYLPLEIFTRYKQFRRKALKLINQINPDIIHAYGTESAYSLAVTNLKYPVVVSIQGIISEILKEDETVLGILRKKYEKVVIRNTINFDCRTTFDKQFIATNNPKARIFEIPRAVNTDFFKRSWKCSTKKTLLFVGSLIPKKGLHILLSSLSIIKNTYPTISLNIIGDTSGKYNNTILEYIKKNKLISNIKFLGFQNASSIAREMADCSLFVLPTLMDNSPNALAEAMAVGTPGIASNVGGVPSMITDGYDGFLVEPGNSEKLAEKILAIIDDKSLLKRISSNARKTAVDRNYPEKVAKRTIEVYKQIIENES